MARCQRTLGLIFFLLLSFVQQDVAIAQETEDISIITMLISVPFDEGEYEYVLDILDEYKETSGATVENPVLTTFRIVSLYYLARYDEALAAISTYKRQHPGAEGEIHNNILLLEPVLTRTKAQFEGLGRVVDSASARQFSQTHYGSSPSTPVTRMIDLYQTKENGYNELNTLRQKRYEAEVWIDGAEGPIYGGLAVGLGGWLVLDLAEDKETRQASNYFLIAGAAIVAWGFYKLISNQNKYADYTERIQALEQRLSTIDSDIYSAKLDILALIEF